MPTAKVTEHKTEIPAQIWADLKELDAMFDDQAGLGSVLQGKGEPGVRSRGQADMMARLGSSRPKERAVAIEESAETLAGRMLRLKQDHSEQRFQVQLEGKELTFTAEQFTKDYEVKVDGHSSSPIFVEDRKHDAITLREAKAIDRETLLDMFDPPNLQDLKERLKKIEKAELEAHQQENVLTNARRLVASGSDLETGCAGGDSGAEVSGLESRLLPCRILGIGRYPNMARGFPGREARRIRH